MTVTVCYLPKGYLDFFRKSKRKRPQFRKYQGAGCHSVFFKAQMSSSSTFFILKIDFLRICKLATSRDFAKYRWLFQENPGAILKISNHQVHKAHAGANEKIVVHLGEFFEVCVTTSIHSIQENCREKKAKA